MLQTSEQKDLKDQPFQNQLGAGNSVKDAGAEFKLGDKAELPTAQQAADQLEKAVPEFFKPSGEIAYWMHHVRCINLFMNLFCYKLFCEAVGPDEFELQRKKQV